MTIMEIKMVSSNSEAIDPSIRLPRNLFQALQSAAQIEKRTVPVQAERIIRQWLVSQGYMSAPTQHQNGAVIVPNSAAHDNALSVTPHADEGTQKTGERSTQDDAGDEQTLQPTTTASATASSMSNDLDPWWKNLRLASGHPPSGRAAEMLGKSGVTSLEEALAMGQGAWRMRGASNAILAALDRHRHG